VGQFGTMTVAGGPNNIRQITDHEPDVMAR
jgi:hypothetical protein